MKVLQICNKPPYPPVDGGTLAMNSITQGLMAAGHEVKVLSVFTDKHPVQQSHIPQEYLSRTRFESVYIDLTPNVLDAAVAMLCGESYHVKRYVSRAFEKKLDEILQKEDFDVVQMEGIFLTPYVNLVRRRSHAKIVLRAHNVENQIWERMSKSCRNPLKRQYLKHLALTLKAYEAAHINDYDAVACITQNDANYFKASGCRKPLASIPFSVTPEPIENIDVEEHSLFHLGSMDWMPNVEGIDWFLTEVWPKVHQEVPLAHIYIAGRKMPQRYKEIRQEGVTVVGEVPDAMYFIASKQINVVPLLSGSGIRVKIIEAMSAGKTVITTTVGAQGICYEDGKHILIANTPDEFVHHIKHCIEDPSFCRTIGQNAYNLIVNEYTTEKLTQKLIGFYDVESPD